MYVRNADTTIIQFICDKVFINLPIFSFVMLD